MRLDRKNVLLAPKVFATASFIVLSNFIEVVAQKRQQCSGWGFSDVCACWMRSCRGANDGGTMGIIVHQRLALAQKNPPCESWHSDQTVSSYCYKPIETVV